MQAQINRLNNLIRQHQADRMSINAQKIRLQNQMIILLQQNNSLRDKLSRSNIRNTDDLKRQNQRLRLEIEEVLNRSSAGADNQHLEQLYQEIDRLNMFIHQREGSYLQMMEDIQQLKNRVIEYQSKPKQSQIQLHESINQYQNQVLELKCQIQNYRSQISQRGFDIVRLNQQVDQLNTQLQQKTNISKIRNDKQDQQIQKLLEENKKLNQMNITRHTLSLVQPISEIINPSQITQKTFSNVHLSNMECKRIESNDQFLQIDVTSLALQESEWRGKEYEWEKDRLKMQAEITKLKGQLYNIDFSHQQVLKDQANKYQQYISLINTQLAQMKLKLKQITDIQSKQAQEKPKLNKNLRLQSKLKIAKKTIKQLNIIKQQYQKILIDYDKLSKQNSQLKQNLIINSTKNLQGVSTNTSLPLFNPQSSKAFTLNEIQSQQLIKQEFNDSIDPQKKQVNKSNHTKQYEKWLILQGKIQRIKEQNKYLKLTRAVSSYKNY